MTFNQLWAWVEKYRYIWSDVSLTSDQQWIATYLREASFLYLTSDGSKRNCLDDFLKHHGNQHTEPILFDNDNKQLYFYYDRPSKSREFEKKYLRPGYDT